MCTACPSTHVRRFRQKCDLDAHLASSVHAGRGNVGGRFQCQRCDDVFSQRTQFDRHYEREHRFDTFNALDLNEQSIEGGVYAFGTCEICSQRRVASAPPVGGDSEAAPASVKGGGESKDKEADTADGDGVTTFRAQHELLSHLSSVHSCAKGEHMRFTYSTLALIRLYSTSSVPTSVNARLWCLLFFYTGI